MSRLWLAPESACLPPLLAEAQLTPAQHARAAGLTRELIGDSGARALDILIRRVRLDSPAGTALLSLAEALLRVPDADNANRLIRDQLGSGALGKPLAFASRIATPLVRAVLYAAVRALGAHFVYAESIESALARVRREQARTPRGALPARYSFDMLGEAALTADDAGHYAQAYEHAIHALGEGSSGHAALEGGSISVKLSALHPHYSEAKRARVLGELLPRLRQLARAARRYRLGFTIDAEEAERLELSLELLEALMSDRELDAWSGLGFAVQAYQKRAPAVIEQLRALAAHRSAPLSVRLVKGAYWDSEIKLAQMQGLEDFAVYTRKAYTDVAYLACARRLLDSRGHLRPQFATHNASTVAAILVLAQDAPAEPLEFQRLHGMGEMLYAHRRALGSAAVRVYAPVGERSRLLAYLMRRLLENGAAASFVRRAAADPAALDTVLADPVSLAARSGGASHPQIALPPDLFEPERRNSRGLELADPLARAPLIEALARSREELLRVQPMLALEARPAVSSERPQRELRNPADRGERIGTVTEADETDLERALAAAEAGAHGWAQTEIESRARLLERAAQLIEEDAPALIALAVREAGRTLANGLGEVREAVDFLRYYAAQIRAEFDRTTHVPLGAVACISPWNFPLAIFTGQIAAALAAGNTVLAKPAEQTPAIAARAVHWLHRAGIPRSALQLLPGAGERIGARLVADPRVRGVVFTGSTEAARAVARALAVRAGEVALIAETGGQNAMIVDSTALPEQVVADVLRSAFDSAGQRCSALRLLCLQHEIAEPVLAMLEGAMRELRVGDPADIATDVGPMIDEPARERIREHLATQPRPRCEAPLQTECSRGVFQAPTLLEISSIDQLRREVFGPVLHVVRFDRRHLGRLVEQINATGYGLTLGIASRIGATTRFIIERARVGNIYVNRNIIGAVVGVQPFGGRGLSGTGPKAGGPLYLHRLLRTTPGPRQPRTSVPRNAALHELLAWLPTAPPSLLSLEQRQGLAERARDYARRTLFGARLALRGYVGESNELRLNSRGVLRATARTPAALIGQLAAALATGNRLRADDRALAERVASALPTRLARLLCAEAGPCEMALVDGQEASLQPQWLHALQRELAALEGPIVPLLISEDGYALERLLFEQVVSVNTAAVGGDVRLLGLAD